METALIISAILQIVILICFFILCSNVGKIKKHLIQSSDFTSKFKFLMEIGEKEKAREILIDRILANNYIFNTETRWTAEEKIQKCYQMYAEEFTALGFNLPKDIETKKE